MGINGDDKPHPLLGLVQDEEDAIYVDAQGRRPRPSARRERSLLGTVWDDEKAEPVPPPPPLPPVNIAELAEQAEPGVRTLARKVLGKALRILARAVDPED